MQTSKNKQGLFQEQGRRTKNAAEPDIKNTMENKTRLWIHKQEYD